ncbi:hypothetical protein GCM10010272_69990 [Streptomyces lateritius]|nr:hypothetical protein GCM10010272_69990 [Streptomyces lateritius]
MEDSVGAGHFEEPCYRRCERAGEDDVLAVVGETGTGTPAQKVDFGTGPVLRVPQG